MQAVALAEQQACALALKENFLEFFKYFGCNLFITVAL